MLVIVNYGVGNLGSILNMLKKAGEESIISSDPSVVDGATKIILPGVGSFDYGMEKLNESGLIQVLNKKVLDEKIPMLGICLGMQLMAGRSEEGNAKGLGWIDGQNIRFRFDSGNPSFARTKIPQMGWNEIHITQPVGIFREMEPAPRFYFVHSYHLQCNDPLDISATTFYGYEFPCAIRHGNISGVQFHPEKSHKFGLRLLKNFATE